MIGSCRLRSPAQESPGEEDEEDEGGGGPEFPELAARCFAFKFTTGKLLVIKCFGGDAELVRAGVIGPAGLLAGTAFGAGFGAVGNDFAAIGAEVGGHERAGSVVGKIAGDAGMGAEVEGVSRALLRLSDTVAEIPMRGKKESLNVSVAAGVFLYRLLDQ